MRYFILVLFVLAISITSCRKDFDTVPSSGKLAFSKTTVYLDTVFTNIGSSTYMLKVYNRSNDDITIPSIALAKGDASKYRLMVDGMTGIDGPDANTIGDGKIFPNVELLANDSLFVFIETTADIADANPADMLYTDEILFDAGIFQQKVNLVTLIQDAIFLFPDRTPNGTGGYSYENLQLDDADPDSKIYGFELTGSELNFTNSKPYVIYGYAGVKSGDVLTINPGARIHFHDQSGIFVKNGGSIQVKGTASPTATPLLNEVIFEGDRLEPAFAETPGQWGMIYLAEGSKNNIFDHTTIKNATVGVFVDRQEATSTVQIKNTQIYNTSNYGIIARKGKINGENIVVNNAGKSSLACILGGTYDFLHCTFANFWASGTRQSPTVYLDNSYTQNDAVLVFPQLQANFTNSIIYGANNIELGINKVDVAGLVFTTNMTNCLIRFNDINNQFAGNNLYTSIFAASNNNLMSTNVTPFDPKFKNAIKNQMSLLTGSSAIGNGKDFPVLPNDIKNTPRPVSPAKPDMGAYQFP
jgi:hypothetical protein